MKDAGVQKSVTEKQQRKVQKAVNILVSANMQQKRNQKMTKWLKKQDRTN